MTGRRHLTTAERQCILTLFVDGHLSRTQIQVQTGYTRHQVNDTIRSGRAEVAPRSGRPTHLSDEEALQLVEFVCATAENRRMPFVELAATLFDARFGMWAIKSTLYRLGFLRRVAKSKPPISETNRRKRLDWAIEHRDWTAEDWARLLWSDETWVTGGFHRRQFVTRRPGEEHDPTCVIERHQRKQGWLFWGCFSSQGKGPGVSWEKDWGTVTKISYSERIVPLIDGWVRQQEQTNGIMLALMQDNAPSHAARDTIAELESRGVTVISWPPYSPDLNPIETVWNVLKDAVEERSPQKPTTDQLRQIVRDSYESIDDACLRELVEGMPARCAAVIEANGLHIHY